MATSGCTSCGLQECQCRRQASTTVSRDPNDATLEITPACCCACYSFWTSIFFIVFILSSGKIAFGKPGSCYLQLFAHSVSVSVTASNANISTADWRIGLTALSPVTGCKISLHGIKSRLLRGEDVISESHPSFDIFGQLVTYEKTDGRVIHVDFEKVVMPRIIGGVVRDCRVEITAGVTEIGHGFLMVLCGDLPVKFTADPAGNVTGSLLGNMKRCDYLSRDNLNLSF